MMRPHKDVTRLGVILLAAIGAMGLLRVPVQGAEASVAPGTQAPPAAATPAKAARPATGASKVRVAAPVKVTEVEGITEYRLSNGLRVLLFPDQSKPTITVNVTYLVGSRHENYGETGMAHLLEHMMFKGTPKNPDIGKEFNSTGYALQWHDLAGPHQLLRAVSGQRGQPGLGVADGSGPDGQLLHCQEGPRHGNDGGSQ